MTLFYDNPTILEECQLCMHVDHVENVFFAYFGRMCSLLILMDLWVVSGGMSHGEVRIQ
jgi:hypothetical protein